MKVLVDVMMGFSNRLIGKIACLSKQGFTRERREEIIMFVLLRKISQTQPWRRRRRRRWLSEQAERAIGVKSISVLFRAAFVFVSDVTHRVDSRLVVVRRMANQTSRFPRARARVPRNH